ncbi:hypothetical protein BT63DRAFT_452621 [Microthyrium microscopicum]|uniref:Uncharacterized protein n=1 Tax=Microthyrium microscopicum TaxID=703497 RepID=A0A6A6UIJ7_9PEZI|nr:hypothetical protein BT63DRAFT_452621 [Microthyrium microscopicum]
MQFSSVFFALASIVAMAAAAPTDAATGVSQATEATQHWCDDHGFRREHREHDDCIRYHDRCHERREWNHYC